MFVLISEREVTLNIRDISRDFNGKKEKKKRKEEKRKERIHTDLVDFALNKNPTKNVGYAFEKQSKTKIKKKRKPISRTKKSACLSSARSIKTNKKLQSLILVRFQEREREREKTKE